MKVTIEGKNISKDFGDSHSMRISAFTPRDIFRLGVILKTMCLMGCKCAHSETPDGKGMFIRIPLNEDHLPPPNLNPNDIEQ